MSTHFSAFSRRKMLTGLGVSVGAVAASGIALPDVAGAATNDSDGLNGLGNVAPGALPQALTVTSGLTYTALNVYALRPINGGTVSIDSTGAYSPDTLAGQLNVPHGATLKEIDAWGNGPAVIRTWRAPHNTGGWTNIGEITIPDGSGMQTIHGTIADELVNLGDNSYLVMVYGTASGESVQSIRVGYRAPAVMTPVSPIARVLDTRSGAKLAAGSDTTVNLGLPASAQSAILTLTLTETTGSSGYVGVYPGNVATWPGNSNINWFGTDQNLATGLTTAVSPTGTIKLRVGENATHVIVDVQGYLG